MRSPGPKRTAESAAETVRAGAAGEVVLVAEGDAVAVRASAIVVCARATVGKTIAVAAKAHERQNAQTIRIFCWKQAQVICEVARILKREHKSETRYLHREE